MMKGHLRGEAALERIERKDNTFSISCVFCLVVCFFLVVLLFFFFVLEVNETGCFVCAVLSC